ncbi:MAG TPA: hypothetical protein VFU10_10785 [Gaiellaceae bacterium]|nr:hypothetical protein [Gaiellaceae bacterium]
MLALHRQAGNRALGRLLQRSPSGLKDAKTTSGFTNDALSYWRDADNQSKGIGEFANFLATKANEALKALDVPAMKIVFDSGIPYPAAFYSDDWAMKINTTMWGKKQGARALKDLTVDEAAASVALIYHEARHAEQRFRVARILAADSKAKTPADVADEIARTLKLKNRGVAVAAAGKPLTDTSANAALRTEARDWQAITVGDHAAYRDVVNTWVLEALNEYAAIGRLGAKPMEIGSAKGTIDPVITGWETGGKRAKFIAAHIREVEAKKKKTAADAAVLTNLKAIQAAMTKVAREWSAIESKWGSTGMNKKLEKVRDFRDHVFALYTALQAAYEAQAHERDAFDTGNPVADQFKAAVTAAPAKKPDPVPATR